MCSCTQPVKHRDYVIHALCMSEQQKMRMIVDLPTSILNSLFSALMFTGIHNKFPLLTMIQVNIKAANKEAEIKVERSTKLHIFCFFTQSLCMNYNRNVSIG